MAMFSIWATAHSASACTEHTYGNRSCKIVVTPNGVRYRVKRARVDAQFGGPDALVAQGVWGPGYVRVNYLQPWAMSVI